MPRETLTSPINPIKRIRNQNNLTQANLAILSKVTPQVVTSVEAGLFNKLPTSVSSALSSIEGQDFTVPQLEALYNQWIIAQRLYMRSEGYWDYPHLSSTWHNFRRSIHPKFRGFCRLLVFQPSILKEFEERNLNRSLVASALNDVGYDSTTIRWIMDLPKDGTLIYQEGSATINGKPTGF